MTRPSNIEFVVVSAEDLFLFSSGEHDNMRRVTGGTSYPCQMQRTQHFSCLFRHYAKHNGLDKESLVFYFLNQLLPEDTPESIHLLPNDQIRVQHIKKNDAAQQQEPEVESKAAAASSDVSLRSPRAPAPTQLLRSYSKVDNESLQSDEQALREQLQKNQNEQARRKEVQTTVLSGLLADVDVARQRVQTTEADKERAKAVVQEDGAALMLALMQRDEVLGSRADEMRLAVAPQVEVLKKIAADAAARLADCRALLDERRAIMEVHAAEIRDAEAAELDRMRTQEALREAAERARVRELMAEMRAVAASGGGE